jgi:Polysaccharide deacetylase
VSGLCALDNPLIMSSPLQELKITIAALNRGDYPQFIVKNGFSGQPPVFFYHRIDAAVFNEQLAHLHSNGYFTVTADEYCQLVQKGKSINPKAVILTFDDGLEDLYTVAYPLLKKYNFNATAFLIPKWIGTRGMVSWDQVVEMDRAGVIDIQSHSFSHASMFTSGEILDFFRGSPKPCHPWELPVVRRDGEDCPMKPSDLGAPIFVSGSRLSDSRRYFPDPIIERACMEAVAAGGGEQFFHVRGWRSRLLNIVHEYWGTTSTSRYEERGEQKNAIKRELILSRQYLEEKLLRKSVKHLAFPWSQIGKITTSLLAECGYESAYAGLPCEDLPYRGPQLQRINRVNGDFVLRLPGIGRRSLLRIFLSKSKRRLAYGQG